MKRFIVAGIILLLNAVVALGGAALGICALIAGKGVGELLKEYFVADFVDNFVKFIVPFFEENAALVLISGAVVGILAIFAAVGLLRNRVHGAMLSEILSIVALIAMPFMLPIGLLSGVLYAAVLLLVLTGAYGKASPSAKKESGEKIELL